ncbi:hypothetical protein QTP86_034422, partial [Hemibagrus guttatus]
CQFKKCSCAKNYSWSKDVCEKNPECCQNNICPPKAMCLHEKRVHVNGSFTIQDDELVDGTRENLTTKMELHYSTLDWFDSLQITNLRSGSVIGDFVMLINGPIDMNQFLKKTTDLQSALQATFKIITTGIISIEAPSMVDYNTSVNIICTASLQTLDNVKWYIEKNAIRQSITNGTEATVFNILPTSTVKVTETSEVWRASEGNTTIYKHKISINCSKKWEEYNATCTFTNRANNKRSTNLTIPVIYNDSVTCPEENGWPEAKANFSAKMQCNPYEVGSISRQCTYFQNKGKWGEVYSECVNSDIWALLIQAQNLQKGCGLVVENAVQLFHLLKTKSEEKIIKTFQNIKTSVDVLYTMNNASEKQVSKLNESVVTGFFILLTGCFGEKKASSSLKII